MRYIREYYTQPERLYYTISEMTYQNKKIIKMDDRIVDIIESATEGRTHTRCLSMYSLNSGIHISGYEYIDDTDEVGEFEEEDKHEMSISIYAGEDDYFYVRTKYESNNYGSNDESYKCDQIEGLLQYLKVAETEFYNQR